MENSLKAERGDLLQNDRIAPLLKQVDRTRPLWAVATVSDAYRKLLPPFFGPFESALLEAEVKSDTITASITAQAKPGGKFETALALFDGGVKEIRKECQQGIQLSPAFGDMIAALDTLKHAQADGAVTLTGEYKNVARLLAVPLQIATKLGAKF